MNLQELAKTIRKVRQSQGMTLDQLSAKSGFSKGFISQVENFRQTPSLKALVKIAEALGLSVSALFSDGGTKAPRYTFGRLANGELLQRDNSSAYGMNYFALAYQQIGRKMDPFILEFTPAEPRGYMRHDTEEFFVIIEGEVNYCVIDDDHCRLMKAGDTVYVQANIPHRVTLADGCTYAKGLVIYTAPEGEVYEDQSP